MDWYDSKTQLPGRHPIDGRETVVRGSSLSSGVTVPCRSASNRPEKRRLLPERLASPRWRHLHRSASTMRW